MKCFQAYDISDTTVYLRPVQPFLGIFNKILIIITIIDIYPGSFSHPKVVFREVLHPIQLEFGNVDF